MKKILLIPFLALFILPACKEKTATEKTTEKPSVSKEYILNDRGLGNLRIGMPLEDVEKELNQQFDLKNMGEHDSWLDTARSKYKNVPLELYFERMYRTDTEFDKVLSAFKFNSPEIRTDKNIGVGSSFQEVINAYEGYIMNIYPEFADTTYTTRSKTKSVINVAQDESEMMLVFYMENKKVREVEATRNYGEH